MKDREKWMELCRQASVEQDPKKLLELAAEIIRLLDEKEDRLIHRATKPEGDPTPQLVTSGNVIPDSHPHRPLIRQRNSWPLRLQYLAGDLQRQIFRVWYKSLSAL